MSEAWKPGISYADLTDVGMRRSNNQDSYASLPAESEQRFSSKGHLFVVADGMGAHAAGELASCMATERIAMHYFRASDVDPVDALCDAVHDTNAEIFRRGQENPEFHGMGTTASSLALLPEGAVIAHVGDSRVYRLRDGTLEQLTFDHSLVWEMEASGQVHPDSALGQSIPKNVITRSLGPNAEVAVDVEGPHAVRAGDVFLLCSDGLTGQVDDKEIGALIDCLPEDKASRVLVDLANLRGGPDNSTVIIVRVTEELSARGSKPHGRSSRGHNAASPLLFGTAGACLLGATALALAGLWGPMVVAILLGIIATVVGGVQYRNHQLVELAHRRRGSAGNRGPYRRYSAAATEELNQRLGETVQALRAAAAEKNWAIDWNQIDLHQRSAQAAMTQHRPKDAVREQAEAIIETMHQLRKQHDRAASETALDQ